MNFVQRNVPQKSQKFDLFRHIVTMAVPGFDEGCQRAACARVRGGGLSHLKVPGRPPCAFPGGF